MTCSSAALAFCFAPALFAASPAQGWVLVAIIAPSIPRNEDVAEGLQARVLASPPGGSRARSDCLHVIRHDKKSVLQHEERRVPAGRAGRASGTAAQSPKYEMKGCVLDLAMPIQQQKLLHPDHAQPEL